MDIDVVFTNHSLDRESALQAIAAELSAISQKLEAMGYEVLQRRNSANNESKLIVQSPLAQVKVEVNEVFRGTLLPLQQRSLSPATEAHFAQAVTLRCLSALLSARGAWVEHLNAVYCALLFMGHESRKSVAFQYPFVGGCAGP